MSAQLEHAPIRLRGPKTTLPENLSRRREAEPADGDPGVGLLFRFLVSTAVVVAVVRLVAGVDQMWILIPAMAIHLAVTYVVLHGIFLLVGDGVGSEASDAR